MKIALFILFFPLMAIAQERALYEVPVTEDLKSFANYELAYFRKDVAGNRLELRYMLPSELTGTSEVLAFAGNFPESGDKIVLTGKHGRMECAAEMGSLQSCAVRYAGLNVNLKKVAELLDARRASPEEKMGKLAVAKLFAKGGGDIGGVITYVQSASVYNP